MNWSKTIINIKSRFDIQLLPPLTIDEINILNLTNDLKEFYSVTNGLFYSYFEILPLIDYKNIKKTWDSLQRANDINNSRFFIDENFIDEFVIFSDIGTGEYGAYKKSNGSIWYSENNSLYETTLTLEEFIKVNLREASE